jgi:hypothetical protein
LPHQGRDNAAMVDTVVCDLYMQKLNAMDAIAYLGAPFPACRPSS